MNSLKLICKALDFAAKKHRDQRRKDRVASPYINHPISLMTVLVNEAGVTDEDVIVSAILHDTIEDTATTAEEIEAVFGAKVRSIVVEVTDDRSLPRSERKALQIKHASHLSKEAAQVKIADKIANLRDLYYSPPMNWTDERRQEYREWAEKVVTNIKDPHQTLLVIFKTTIQLLSAQQTSSSKTQP